VLSEEGGFGRTYMAEDVDKLNELCVVKQLAPKIQGTYGLKKAVELFQEEAKRLQELGKNPQIPTLLAYFEQDHYMYLVQEFIDGQNLLQELETRGTYGEDEIRELLLDLLPVLQFIHERGVIHRDIKPQNIMARSPQPFLQRRANSLGGDLVLIDFGASKQLTATVQLKPGTTIGSFGYSPIEQIKVGEAYPASDLFSLGATCFHLLSGNAPFGLWAQHGYSWVANWREHVNSPVSDELGEVIDKLLKVDKEERYQSADEVMEDLTPKPSAAPPPQQSSVPPTAPVTPAQATTQPTPPVAKPITQLMPAIISNKRPPYSQFVILVGLVLVAGLFGTLWMLNGGIFGKKENDPGIPAINNTPSIDLKPTVISPAPSDRLDVIQTTTNLQLLTNTSPPQQAIAPPGSVLRILNSQVITAQQQNPDQVLYVRICSVGDLDPLAPIERKPVVKLNQAYTIKLSEYQKLSQAQEISTPPQEIIAQCQSQPNRTPASSNRRVPSSKQTNTTGNTE
jgi:serine/threonine protein kinase